ncbi:MAG: ATP-dependent Clp protease ATP-binding subunit [Candidatus Borkfalkiaceae bacterium]|nr:ATP-dependent Clp protease ATP-binding subunit [Christensenellaceae bacterium]
MNNFRCTEGLIQAFKNSQIISQRCKLGYVGTEELLYGLLLLPNCDACKYLNTYGVNKSNYFALLQTTFSTEKKVSDYNTPRVKGALEDAEKIAEKAGVGFVSTEHLLLALLKKRDCMASSLIRRMNIDYDGLVAAIENKVFSAKRVFVGGEENQTEEKKEEESPLDKFGYDLTEKARQGKLDPVIGRSKEIERIIQTLSRRTKNNPVLIGESGVGKSAVVEGFALEIANGTVPSTLRDKIIFSLNLSGVLAGTKYRGEFEQRFKEAVDYVVERGDIIVFIDEIHNIMGAGATGDGSMDLAEMLKPMLARGEFQIIGATTIDEYTKYIEPDPAMERRFQPILVEAPDEETAVKILKGLRDKFEAHHDVQIRDEAIEAAVKLSERYITDRNLPDKAIDLIDEAASKARLKFSYTPHDLPEKEQKLETLIAEKEYNESIGNVEQANVTRRAIQTLRDEIERIEDSLLEARSCTTPSIGEDEVAEIVAEWTKIPITRISASESEKLANLEDDLRERVIGQDGAINSVARAIKRARANVKDPNRPIGTFIFVGPTGVGKTELSKALSEVVFGDKDSLIRLDMSEYMDKSSVSKLIGAPPGYVGYEETGVLSDKVRRKPYSVVLFDEIEKADSEIFNLMLQILDEGRLTDNKGKLINFKNTIIILTSNVGAAITTEKNDYGYVSEEKKEQDLKERIYEALKRKFSPEFLNRLDDIIVFKSLSREDCGKIVDVMLAKLRLRLAESGITLKVAQSATDLIINEGYDETYGARPLRRAIQRRIEDMLSEEIISGRIIRGDEITVYADDGKISYIRGN